MTYQRRPRIGIGLTVSENEERNNRGEPLETRVYVNEADMDIAENFMERISGVERNHRWYREHILPRVRVLLGLEENAVLRWSRNAGCTMCPCSPGFIVTGERTGREVWVEYQERENE